MKKNYFIFLPLILFFITGTDAQKTNDQILNKRWDAYWINVPGAPAHDYGVYHFRKSFELAAKPSKFIINISADNRYKLFVNGTFVSNGPARGDIYNWNFETVDIAPYLNAGKNVLAAVVWNFGEQRQEAQITYQTAFILQGNSDAEKVVNTDKSWKCLQDKAYSPLQPDLIYTYYAAGPTEKINYNEYPSEWQQLNYNDANWQQAQQLFNGLPKGVFYWTLGWMLVPRAIPQMEITQQRIQTIRSAKGVDIDANFLQGKKSFSVPANTSATVLIDQDFLTTAYPVLQFSKGKNAVIDISYAEALYVDEGSQKDWREQNQKGNRNEVAGKRFVGPKDELIADGNNNSFTSLMWRTYRYIQLTVTTKDEAITIDDIYGLYEGYPFKYNAGLESDDTSLSKILETGWRTARLDAHETYMDCPFYEQLQYVGDTRIQCMVSLYNSGDDRLVRNAISQIYNSLMPEGITLSRYPTANPQQIPTFSLLWIGMLHDYWMYRGDTSFIQKNLQVSRLVLSYFNKYQSHDGSLKNVPYWLFTDWVDDIGWDAGVAPFSVDRTSAILDLQLLMAYQTAAALEQQVGMKAFADKYLQEAEKIKQSIQKNYWDEKRKMFADTKEKIYFSQHANSLAILTGLLQEDAAKNLAEKMITDTGISKATVYFRYYLHLAMLKAGLGDKYLDMLGKWKENLAMGMTTWAEIDDINHARSDCHAWGSSPNIELFRIVLGIDSDAPGFSHIKIEPHLGTLKKISGYIPHPAGKIFAGYTYNETEKKWNINIQLPVNITGSFIWKGNKYLLKAGANEMTLE